MRANAVLDLVPDGADLIVPLANGEPVTVLMACNGAVEMLPVDFVNDPRVRLRVSRRHTGSPHGWNRSSHRLQ